VLALANSTLVSRYCGQSPELRLLARKVKEFATAWNVKSGKDGTLSSYGYTLLCIHFLQNAPLTGANVPVLPVFPGWQSDYGKLSDRENADPNNKVIRGHGISRFLNRTIQWRTLCTES
jgi:DNA polymerase sigma